MCANIALRNTSALRRHMDGHAPISRMFLGLVDKEICQDDNNLPKQR